jgi:hypothetical protein
MAKVFLVNPRPAATAPQRERRSSWDRHAVRRILNASGAWDIAEEGGHMAHRKEHHRRHHRRNPDGKALLWGVAGAAGGLLITGPAAGMISSSGLLNYASQGAIALGGGWLLAKFREPLGYGFAVGGLASLAIQLYRDYVGSSSGVSLYTNQANPLQDFVTGNPLSWAAYGATSALPAAAPAAAAAASGAAAPSKMAWSPTKQSRLFSKAA